MADVVRYVWNSLIITGEWEWLIHMYHSISSALSKFNTLVPDLLFKGKLILYVIFILTLFKQNINSVGHKMND